jgi:hypothetical protein
MKPILFALAIFAAGASLVACANDGPHGPPPGYGPGPLAFDGYYDDGYGPFYDGYWGDDGAFYYAPRQGEPFRRDDAGHFRRDSAQGFHPVHGLGGPHPGAPHFSGGGAGDHRPG